MLTIFKKLILYSKVNVIKIRSRRTMKNDGWRFTIGDRQVVDPEEASADIGRVTDIGMDIQKLQHTLNKQLQTMIN